MESVKRTQWSRWPTDLSIKVFYWFLLIVLLAEYLWHVTLVYGSNQRIKPVSGKLLDSDFRKLRMEPNQYHGSATLPYFPHVDSTNWLSVKTRLMGRNEVMVPCSECKRYLNEFIKACADLEAKNFPYISFGQFCNEKQLESRIAGKEDYVHCMDLQKRLNHLTQSTFASFGAAMHFPSLCIQFSSLCGQSGGGPGCYSGVCDVYIQCTDCPTAWLDGYGDGQYRERVCADRGVCKKAWESPYGQITGYCECEPYFRGLACNQQ